MTKGIKEKDIRDFEKYAGKLNDVIVRIRKYCPDRHGKQYRCEMDNNGHEALLDMLLKHKGYVIISGYDTELYNDMLAGWNKFEKDTYSQVMTKKREVIWLNYDPPNRQMSLEDIG